ncbi:MAG TPA: hypothetical protein DDZ96_12605 [Porphyromonadaceae bacterium]|jgi:hypothetical protein|nr:hypothetical protein [Porphyromonadaceae bacterium]HBX21744.1 hypothetical protein [Porphyromonadaceae bacterium]HCM19744.1 hypothetical protein [Porphyromonadaceae bacterium]
MAQTVSNDALWEKLSEIDRKFEKFIVMQESQAAAQEQNENMPGLEKARDTIITEIRQQITLLDKHNDSNFGANRQNIEILNKNILSAIKHTREVNDQLKTYIESQKEDEKNHFNIKLFKVRKTSFVIAVLGLLVFLLIVFCMKQQNDYTLMANEYYKQMIAVEHLKGEIKDLKNINEISPGKKKK